MNSARGAVSLKPFDQNTFKMCFFFILFQDFRSARSQQVKVDNWLKHIGKLSFPVHMLLKFYQMIIVCFDLWFMSILTYKEMVLALFYFIVPLPKKTLVNELAVVSTDY